MTNSAKSKGDRAELEAARRLADLTGYPCRRRLGAGRLDDCGDLDIPGVPACISVKNRRAYDRIPQWLTELRTQQTNAGATFAALWLRRPGGKFLVVMDDDQFATLLREACEPSDEVARLMDDLNTAELDAGKCREQLEQLWDRYDLGQDGKPAERWT